MPIDINNLNPAAKFFYSKDEWVEFRTIPMSKLREWRKETIDPKVEYYSPDGYNGQPYRYEIEDVNDDKLFELMWDYQIVNWNIADPKGKEIPCTLKNKILLIANSKEFADFALSSIRKLNEDEEKRREKLEKN